MSDILLQVHDQLHKGNVDAAHELLHKALGLDNESDAVRLAPRPLAHMSAFDNDFRKLCQKHGIRAMFVADGGKRHEDGKHRILTGGSAELCRAFARRLGAQP